jgi:hypothetical protein
MGRIEAPDPGVSLPTTAINFKYRVFRRITTKNIPGIHARFNIDPISGFENAIVAWSQYDYLFTNQPSRVIIHKVSKNESMLIHVGEYVLGHYGLLLLSVPVSEADHLGCCSVYCH